MIVWENTKLSEGLVFDEIVVVQVDTEEGHAGQQNDAAHAQEDDAQHTPPRPQ